MSRSDYLFLSTLGHRYFEKGQEFEVSKNFENALQSYITAEECFGRAEQIVKEDMMNDHGSTEKNRKACERKVKSMRGKCEGKDVATDCRNKK